MDRGAVAHLADVDPIAMPTPQVVHVVSREEIARLLPPRDEIPGVAGSQGAYLRADAALSLTDPEEPGRAGDSLALPDRRRRRMERDGTPYADGASRPELVRRTHWL